MRERVRGGEGWDNEVRKGLAGNGIVMQEWKIRM